MTEQAKTEPNHKGKAVRVYYVNRARLAEALQMIVELIEHLKRQNEGRNDYNQRVVASPTQGRNRVGKQ